MRFTFFFLLIVIAGPYSVYGQLPERLYQSDYRIDSSRKGELRLEVDNLSFFKNNEFSNYFMKGYTIPGFWVQPKLVYSPLENIKLEAGVHALCFWGADAYPNAAYLDIPRWKSDRYQLGCHLLPYFRAQMSIDQVTFVLGNLYGGANHRLIDPLYVPELNLTADPETGLQLIWQTPVIHFDAWINWDSFIFYNDYHQEVFTVGLSSRIQVNRPESPLHVYFPVQGVLQHRGGQMLDEIYTHSVQTLMNGAAGMGFVWNANRKVLKRVELESEMAGYYQESGSLWHVDTGTAFYVRAAVQLTDFRIKASFWKSRDFMSLFGYSFYGAASICYEDLTCPSHRLVYWGAEYSRSFGKGYSIGIDFDMYHHLPTVFNTASGKLDSKAFISYSFGVYIRMNPSFLLKKFIH